jgi:hypothetical protein
VELNCGGEEEVQTGGRKGKAMEAEDVDENPPEQIRSSWAVAAFIRVEGHASTVQAGGSDARNPPGVPKRFPKSKPGNRTRIRSYHVHVTVQT